MTTRLRDHGRVIGLTLESYTRMISLPLPLLLVLFLMSVEHSPEVPHKPTSSGPYTLMALSDPQNTLGRDREQGRWAAVEMDAEGTGKHALDKRAASSGPVNQQEPKSLI